MAWVFFGAETDFVLVPRFLGLNIKNFGISSGQSWTMLRFGFYPKIDVFEFC